MPLVHNHIGSGGHVARDAIGGPRSVHMAGVLLRREARGLMTLPANFGSGEFQLARMRIMAVAANDALRIHQALFKQMIVENFVLHLAVVFKEVFGQERRQMRIQQRLARTPSFVDLAAPRMAMRAKLNFVRGRTRRAFCRAADFWIGRPFDFFPTRVASVEALVGPPRIAPAFRPIEMISARPMAKLATDSYLGETRVKTVLLRIVSLLDTR